MFIVTASTDSICDVGRNIELVAPTSSTVLCFAVPSQEELHSIAFDLILDHVVISILTCTAQKQSSLMIAATLQSLHLACVYMLSAV